MGPTAKLAWQMCSDNSAGAVGHNWTGRRDGMLSNKVRIWPVTIDCVPAIGQIIGQLDGADLQQNMKGR